MYLTDKGMLLVAMSRFLDPRRGDENRSGDAARAKQRLSGGIDETSPS
jgi:hypothetical protein